MIGAKIRGDTDELKRDMFWKLVEGRNKGINHKKNNKKTPENNIEPLTKTKKRCII